MGALALALTTAPYGLAGSGFPDPSSNYVPDRVLVRFRVAPSDTDLEIFTGRQFLSFVQYIGLSYPPRLGWYVFRVEDQMDAALVRDLLRKDPMVCNAELVAIGEYFAVGLPDVDVAPPCVEPAPPQGGTESDDPLNGDGQSPPVLTPAGPSPSSGSPGDTVWVLAAVLALVAGVASWLFMQTRRVASPRRD